MELIDRQSPAFDGMRAARSGMFANFCLAVAKCAAGVLGHSFALIADGIESFSDVFSSMIVWWGLRIAAKPPDRDHPYGHGKAEPIAGVLVGVALIAAACGIAFESIRELRIPHRVPAPYTLVVLLGVFLIKVVLTRFVGSIAIRTESTAVRGDALHHMTDAFTSAVAFIGISVGLLTQNPKADDWAALCATIFILFNGVRQIRRPFAELLDTAPPAKIEESIRGVAGGVAGVLGLDKCTVRKSGFDYWVDLHVIVRGSLSVREGHLIAHRVETAIQQTLPQVREVLVHVEPEEELGAAR